MSQKSELKRYALEVYPPGGSGDDVACTLECEEAFLAIQKGDIINPRTWNGHYASNLQEGFRDSYEHGIVLRVTGLEHFIVQREDGTIVQHKIGIFTEAISDVAESRP